MWAKNKKHKQRSMQILALPALAKQSQNKEFPKLSLAKITLEIHIQRWITIKRDTDTDEQKDAETFVVAASDVSEL